MTNKVVMKVPNVILLDIEGTTSSISFVKECLFPYVRQHLKTYLEEHWNENELDQALNMLRKQAEEDVSSGVVDVPLICDSSHEDVKVRESVVANVFWQMNQDRKTRALKNLQGLVWKNAYESGLIKGHVYDDVPSVMNEWKVKYKINIYIYSSGSVFAQKLLFNYSTHGSLSHLISGNFDITIGSKLVSDSYSCIANAIGCQPDRILFLTDVIKEARAAKDAGLDVLLVVRKGNQTLSENDRKEFQTITSFNHIHFTQTICE